MLVAQLCPTLCDPMDCSPPGSSIHGIIRARVLEWIVIPFSKASFWPRGRIWVSCITYGFFTIWATREIHICIFKTDGCLCVMVVRLFFVSLLVFCEYKNYYGLVLSDEGFGWLQGLFLMLSFPLIFSCFLSPSSSVILAGHRVKLDRILCLLFLVFKVDAWNVFLFLSFTKTQQLHYIVFYLWNC